MNKREQMEEDDAVENAFNKGQTNETLVQVGGGAKTQVSEGKKVKAE